MTRTLSSSSIWALPFERSMKSPGASPDSRRTHSCKDCSKVMWCVTGQPRSESTHMPHDRQHSLHIVHRSDENTHSRDIDPGIACEEGHAGSPTILLRQGL